ncbi:hypothetical protein CRUP_025382 [Coryphaenoides rupestris]|nr:hypothetical protein CRUP_025382 [Coryphaenoides rupestris]
MMTCPSPGGEAMPPRTPCRQRQAPPPHAGADWKVLLHLPELQNWLRTSRGRVTQLTHSANQDTEHRHVDTHLLQLKDICEDISDHVEQIHALLETEFSLKLLSYSVNIIVDIRSVQLLWHQLRVSVLVLKERLLQGLQDSNGNFTRQTDILQAFSQEDQTGLESLTEVDECGQLTIRCSQEYFSLDCGITAFELGDYSPGDSPHSQDLHHQTQDLHHQTQDLHHLQDLHHQTQDLHHPTQDLEDLHHQTQNLQNLHHQTQDLQDLHHQTQDVQDLHLQTQDPQDLHHQTQDLQDLHHQTQDLQDLHLQTQDLQDLHRQIQDLQNLHLQTQELQDLHHQTQDIHHLQDPSQDPSLGSGVRTPPCPHPDLQTQLETQSSNLETTPTHSSDSTHCTPSMHCGTSRHSQASMSKRPLLGGGGGGGGGSPTQPSLAKRAALVPDPAPGGPYPRALSQGEESLMSPSALGPQQHTRFWLDLHQVYPETRDQVYPETRDQVYPETRDQVYPDTRDHLQTPGGGEGGVRGSQPPQSSWSLGAASPETPLPAQKPTSSQTHLETHVPSGGESDSPLPSSSSSSSSDMEASGEESDLHAPPLRQTELLAINLENLVHVLPLRSGCELDQQGLQDIEDWDLTEVSPEGCVPPPAKPCTQSRHHHINISRCSPSSSDIAPSLDESIESGPLSELLSEEEERQSCGSSLLALPVQGTAALLSEDTPLVAGQGTAALLSEDTPLVAGQVTTALLSEDTPLVAGQLTWTLTW